MPEISDQELAVLKRGQALLDKMWNDPKEGMAFKKKVKGILPDANIPELDIVDTATAPIFEKLEAAEKHSKTLEDRLNKWEQAQTDSKEEAALSVQLETVKKQHGFTVEGMQKVIDRMKEKNNPDVESAAAWVASQERRSKPVTDSVLMPSALNLYGSNKEDADYAELNRDPQGWADKKVVSMLNDFANQDAA